MKSTYGLGLASAALVMALQNSRPIDRKQYEATDLFSDPLRGDELNAVVIDSPEEPSELQMQSREIDRRLARSARPSQRQPNPAVEAAAAAKRARKAAKLKTLAEKGAIGVLTKPAAPVETVAVEPKPVKKRSPAKKKTSAKEATA